MVHVAKAIHDRWQALTSTRRGHGANDALVVDDLRILENTAVFAGGLGVAHIATLRELRRNGFIWTATVGHVR